MDNILFNKENPFYKTGRVQTLEKNNSKLHIFSNPDYRFNNEKYISFIKQSPNYEYDDQCIKELITHAKLGNAKRIIGPMCFSSLYDYRVKLFDSELYIPGEPTGTLQDFKTLQKFGFEKIETYSTQYIPDPQAIYKWGKTRSQRVIRQGKKFKTLQIDQLIKNRQFDKILLFLNKLFKNNLGFINISPFDLQLLFKSSIINDAKKAPSFIVTDENGEYVGLFLSYFGKNVFEPQNLEDTLYFKTIGALSNQSCTQAEVFFYLIHQIFSGYDVFTNKKTSICFCLMKNGNVAEKVAQKFSTQKRDYALLSLKLR